MICFPAGTSDADRFAALQAAELIVSTQARSNAGNSGALRAAAARESVRHCRTGSAQFQALQTSAGSSFANLLLLYCRRSPPRSSIPQPFDVSPIGDRRDHDYAGHLARPDQPVGGGQDAHRRRQYPSYDAASAASAADQMTALTAAAKALLGDDFQIIPEFTVSAAQGAEWANAINASTSGDLFTYLKTTLKIDFPVDEWFYGAARVRQPFAIGNRH